MATEVLLSARNVSKKFCRDLRRSLWYGLQDLATEFVGRHHNHERDLRQDEFWAVNDVSFELKQGETLGIIGPNGAGKTSLLRIINGLIKPDRGEVTVRGRVGALIALGAGFNPILTGRENIYINAAVLGLSKRKVDKILDDIIEFADIGKFIDTPVQNYSSGMRVRLGFSVAAHLNPHILLVDEVLSVGDFSFREKSFARMTHICQSGAAVIFVSHNMSAILTICQRVLWLENGQVHMAGSAEEVVKAYLEVQEELAIQKISQENDRLLYHDDQTLFNQMRITKIELMNQFGVPTTSFCQGDNLHIKVHYETARPIPEPHFVIHIGTQRETLLVADMLRDDIAPSIIEGEGVVECMFYNLPLLPYQYVASILVLGPTPTIRIVFPPKRVRFAVVSNNNYGLKNPMSIVRVGGVFPIVSEWHW